MTRARRLAKLEATVSPTEPRVRPALNERAARAAVTAVRRMLQRGDPRGQELLDRLGCSFDEFAARFEQPRKDLH